MFWIPNWKTWENHPVTMCSSKAKHSGQSPGNSVLGAGMGTRRASRSSPEVKTAAQSSCSLPYFSYSRADLRPPVTKSGRDCHMHSPFSGWPVVLGNPSWSPSLTAAAKARRFSLLYSTWVHLNLCDCSTVGGKLNYFQCVNITNGDPMNTYTGEENLRWCVAASKP